MLQPTAIDMPPVPNLPRQRSRWLLIVGVGLVLSGMIADGFAAWFLFTDGIIEGGLVHGHAALSWVVGLWLILPAQHPATPPQRRQVKRDPKRQVKADRVQPLIIAATVDGRVIAAGVLALGLFPGLGMFSWGLAFAATTLTQRRSSGLDEADDEEAPTGARVGAPPTAATIRLIEPLVDRLHDVDLEERRAAITSLGQSPRPESVRALRALLTDAHPDVRSDASVMLAQLEDRCQRQVANGLATVQEEPPLPSAYDDLATAYVTYARSGLLDEVSARHTLDQAQLALHQASRLAPEKIDRWLVLAQVCRERGDLDGALRALHEVAQREPENPERLLLNMAIAFDRRDWSELAALARQRAEGVPLPHNPEHQALLGWWGGKSAARSAW